MGDKAKKLAIGTGMLLGGLLLIYLSFKLFGMKSSGRAAIFYIVRVGFIPVPIPLGIFTLPQFWGVVVLIGGGLLGFAGVGSFFAKE